MTKFSDAKDANHILILSMKLPIQKTTREWRYVIFATVKMN